jgi:predicted Na+-dependent transporter
MEHVMQGLVILLSITTMLNLGLDTEMENLIVNLKWRLLSTPLIVSLVLLPAITFFLLWILGERKEVVWIGLIVAVASAGGSSAGIFVKAIKGDKGFSGSFIVLQSLASSVLLPLLLGFSFSSTTILGTVKPLVTATFLY